MDLKKNPTIWNTSKVKNKTLKTEDFTTYNFFKAIIATPETHFQLSLYYLILKLVSLFIESSKIE